MIAEMCLILLLATANDLICEPDVPSIYEMPFLVTVYDTALCEDGESCLQGNGDGYFASMVPVSDDWYGIMAACDPALFGLWVNVSGLGTVYCGDSFGYFNGEPVETIIQMDDGQWVTRMDVFYPVAANGYPSWNYNLFYDWSVQW